MNAAYDPGAWSSFFAAEVSASAALTGLVIVAVSINLNRLLEERSLSGRAGETVVLLSGVLLLSTCVLVPAQPHWLLGAEILAVALMVGGGRMIILRRAGRHPLEPKYVRELFLLGTALLFALAGVSLILGVGGGLYLLVPAILLAIIGGVLNAWVLLVEILR